MQRSRRTQPTCKRKKQSVEADPQINPDAGTGKPSKIIIVTVLEMLQVKMDSMVEKV